MSLCNLERRDYKGSVILLRKAIKSLNAVFNDAFFEENFLSTPEKKVKHLSLLYFCEIKVIKAVFELSSRTKESFALEKMLLVVASDKFLND